MNQFIKILTFFTLIVSFAACDSTKSETVYKQIDDTEKTKKAVNIAVPTSNVLVDALLQINRARRGDVIPGATVVYNDINPFEDRWEVTFTPSGTGRQRSGTIKFLRNDKVNYPNTHVILFDAYSVGTSAPILSGSLNGYFTPQTGVSSYSNGYNMEVRDGATTYNALFYDLNTQLLDNSTSDIADDYLTATFTLRGNLPNFVPTSDADFYVWSVQTSTSPLSMPLNCDFTTKGTLMVNTHAENYTLSCYNCYSGNYTNHKNHEASCDFGNSQCDNIVSVPTLGITVALP